MDTTTTKTGRRKIVPAATPGMSALGPSTKDLVDAVRGGPVEREEPAATAASLARDLAEIAPPTQMRGLSDDDEDEPIPDNDLRAMLGEQAPSRPEEIKPHITARDATPTHATVARELSAFKNMIGDSQHVEISRENDIGQQVIVGLYRPRDIQPYGTLTNFCMKVLAPNYGGGGVFTIIGTSANGKKYELETVRIDKPIEDPKERGMNDMNRDLLTRVDSLTDKLLEVRSQRPEQPDFVSQMERMEELKKRFSGDSGAMTMMMLMNQNQNRGLDPSVAALTDIVKDLAREMKDLRSQASMPPLPMGPPPVDPMVLALQLADAMRPPPAPPPPDTLGMVMQIAALLKPPPAKDPLETLVALQALSKNTDNTPFKERMEEMFMLKKMMGGDNPFGDILKTFMTSQLGAGLGNGLGDAIRNNKKPEAQPAPQQQVAPQAPAAAAPPDFPAGYLDLFQKQILEAKDDAALVEAVVGSLLMLGGDANWKRFAGAFMSATVTDDLVKVNEMLQVLFNVWAEKGATIGRDKLDLAIKAVNVSWDTIVQKICEVMKTPLPAPYVTRMAAKNAPPAAPEPPRPAVSLVPPLPPEPATVA